MRRHDLIQHLGRSFLLVAVLSATAAHAQVYEFATATDGWSAGECAAFSASGTGTADLSVTCSGPSFRSPAVAIDTAQNPLITVVASGSITGPVDMRFTTQGVEHTVARAFYLRGDGNVRSHPVTLAGVPGWTGTVTAFSFTLTGTSSGGLSIHRISVDPVPFRNSFSFERAGDLEGFLPSDTITGVSVSDGALSGVISLTSSNKPRFESPRWLRIDTRQQRTLSIRIKATSPNPNQSLRVWWGTSTAPTLLGARSISQNYVADGTWKVVHFDLFTHQKWRDEVVVIWVQPFDSPEAGASFALDDVAFEYAIDTATPAPGTQFTTSNVEGARIADGALRGVVTSGSTGSVTIPMRATAALYDRIAVVGVLDPGLPCSLGVAFRSLGGSFTTLAATPNCEGQRFAAVIDVGNNPAWTGRIDALRLDLPGTGGSARRGFRFERVAVQRGVPSPDLASVSVPTPMIAGQNVILTAIVQNRGTEPYAGGKVTIAGTPDFLPTILPFGSATVTRTLSTQSACASGELASITVTGTFSTQSGVWNHSVSINPTWMDPIPALPAEVPPAGSTTSSQILDRAIVIQNDRVRFALLQDDCLGGYGHLRVYGATAAGWELALSRRGLGRAVIVDGETTVDVNLGGAIPKPLSGADGEVILNASQSVPLDSGTTWTFDWTFTLRTGRSDVDVGLTASPNLPSTLRLLEAGAEASNSAVASDVPRALFGGVELLRGAEASSSSLAIQALDANRRTPDPRVVMLSVLAAKSGSVTGGLIYPPDFQWSLSPLLRLLSPRFEAPLPGTGPATLAVRIPPTPTYVAPGDDVAATAISVGANQSVSLQYQLFARPEGVPEAAMRAWWDVFGVPSPAPPDLSTAQLRTRAALSAAFVSGQGFITKSGATPKGYGDVTVVAAALADASGDSVMAGKVAEALALSGGAAWAEGTGDVPTYDALWRLGAGALALDAAWAALQAEHLAPLGGAAALLDGANGVVGSARLAARLARIARLTGVAAARTAAESRLNALLVAWPSGGLLDLGVSAAAPDLAAIVDGLFAFLEGYRLTGTPAYLQRAKELGFAALSFVQPLNNPGVPSGYSQYGAVLAIGAKGFTDSLIGRLSATQGARLAVALASLSRISPDASWNSVAGRIRDAVYRRQRSLDGSATAGWVAEGWDLRSDSAVGGDVIPFIAARATLELEGDLVSTTELATPAGLSVRIAGSGTFGTPAFDTQSYNVTFPFTPASAVRPVLVTAGNLPEPPETVYAAGVVVPKVDGFDAAASGWTYLPGLDLLVVKLAPRADAVKIEFVYPIPDKDNDGAPANVDCNDTVGTIHPGATETCNATDDDCDGDTDDPDATGYQRCGIAQCDHEEPVCILGKVVPCNPEFGKTAEKCDSIDNDCDSYTDEEVGLAPCGTGVCTRLIDACDVCDPFVGKDDESCDGVDNDCDGETDETVGTVFCGTGLCEHLISVCAQCDPFAGKQDESCNLIDDDCDGITDEDQAMVACGEGLCEHLIPQCADCDGLTGAGKEVCNLVDDDCDGETDDGTPTVQCGKGLCERAIPACQECDSLFGKAPEVCNEVDDDCNGVTDDAPGLKPCGTGGCYREIPKCETCVQQGAKDEVCDGTDNDCDGETDELTGAATCGLGVCAHPVTGCVSCEALEGASDETCNALDDDCDGDTDEADDLGVFTCGTGACLQTLPNCSLGESTACDELLGTSTEVCDAVDNDCDGVTDEDIESWVCGIGECAKTILGCTDPSACNPLAGKKSEVCNGKDDDCDGETDEELGFITCGELIGCPQAIPKCFGGKTLECNPNGLAPDICDGVDNDCDASTDENIPVVACGTGICAKTLPGCTKGVPTPCDPLGGALEEVCDFVDNDCDDDIDESSPPTTCGLGICAVTVSGCNGGVPKSCTPKDIAKPDVCNAADDDCDGQTDESQGTITCGKGVCVRELELCVAGVAQACDADTGMAPETCNLLDDDCNGETDEGLGTVSCGLGDCQRDLPLCSAGVPTFCDAFAGLRPEKCDGQDNDCDGETDDQLGDISCNKEGQIIKASGCKEGVAQTCDDVTVGGDDGDDGQDGTDSADGTTPVGPPVSAPPAEGCGASRAPAPGANTAGYVSLGLLGLAAGLVIARARRTRQVSKALGPRPRSAA